MQYRKSLGALALAAAACASDPPPQLPPHSTNNTVGPDDIIGVIVVGDKDASHEYQVEPDGTINFDYLSTPIYVEGLEPQQIAAELKKGFVDARVFKDPQVSLIVKQYNSRKIFVTGAVSHPDTVTWIPGMTIVGAISLSGWFTALADKDHVTLIRKVSKGKSVKAVVNVDAITKHNQEDVPVQPGDTINVSQNVF